MLVHYGLLKRKYGIMYIRNMKGMGCMNSKKFFIAAGLCILLSGCRSAEESSDISLGNSDISDNVAESSETTEETTAAAPLTEYTDSDVIVINWFTESITDSECFSDINDYRYYARTLGLDKDYFLNPEMWEIYYSERLNINREIDEKDHYLIRLNPYKLLDIYAERCDTDVDSLCEDMSVTPPQLYYNWGYNPISWDYGKNHEENKATYSVKEQDIFGAYNGENRCNVMKTHLLEVDLSGEADTQCTYRSSVTSRMSIQRRDSLNAFTKEQPLYSGYTEAEKSPAFTVNGIGIRAVIPLTIPNAHITAADGDTGITAMINVSPYAYGCNDDDIIDIMPYINDINNTEKK